MVYVSYRPLLDTLIARGVDAAAVENAAQVAQTTGRTIRDVLINDDVVPETELTAAPAPCHGMHSLALIEYQAPENFPAASCPLCKDGTPITRF